MQQMALNIELADEQNFASFYSADNAPLVHLLKQAADGQARLVDGASPIVIWGGLGSGRSHLLQAACHHALSFNQRAAYLPMSEASAWQPELLEGMEALDLLCLDDVDDVAADPAWERALFRLLQWQRDSAGCLIIAMRSAPASSEFKLADLVSRLEWGQVIKLHSLSDEALSQALQLRAQCKGLQLTQEVARYLTSRMQRDMPELTQLLNKLDSASLAHQRRMTIPFVKSILESS